MAAQSENQYTVPLKTQRLLEEKARRRAVLREEFLKQISNPHIHATGVGGTVFDSAIQRYIALRATSYDHFKPTPKTSSYGLLLFAVPVLGFAYILKSSRDEKEQLYRTGQVSYKNRSFKFR